MTNKRHKARAAKFRRSIERKDHHVTKEVTIKRIASVELPSEDGTRHPARGLAAAKRGQVRYNYNFQRNRFPKAKLKVYRDRWAVMEGDHMHQSWSARSMAEAHRDGLNYHYAKWLMTKDMSLTVTVDFETFSQCPKVFTSQRYRK